MRELRHMNVHEVEAALNMLKEMGIVEKLRNGRWKVYKSFKEQVANVATSYIDEGRHRKVGIAVTDAVIHLMLRRRPLTRKEIYDGADVLTSMLLKRKYRI